MPDRRETLTLGAAAGLGVLTGLARPAAAEPVPAPRTLQTRLFNFKDDASPESISARILKLKAAAKSPAIDSFMVGQNFIPTPFPTRFEWLYMIEMSDGSGARDPFESAAAELSSNCRNEAECVLHASFPAGFADAAGVKVRHTVMFDFKPEATPEARARNVAAIRNMGRLPMVRRYFVERATVAASAPSQYEWQVIGDFGSVDDYRAYSEAPVHLAIREDFTAHTSRVAFLDVKL